MNQEAQTIDPQGQEKVVNVIRRDGELVPFNAQKIETALRKAFIATDGSEVGESQARRDLIRQLVDHVLAALGRRYDVHGAVHVEEIQDYVELTLMRAGEQKVARSYILYREEQAQKRREEGVAEHPSIRVTYPDGKKRKLNLTRLLSQAKEAGHGLVHTDPQAIVDETVKNLFDGVTFEGVETAMLMAARTRVEKEPEYSFFTARLLLSKLRREVFLGLGVCEEKDLKPSALNHLYEKAFLEGLEQGVQARLISPELLKAFNLKKLAGALKADRDLQHNYLSMQTLYDRYLLHINERRIELPQTLFMRVAMGLALNETRKTEKAIEFYNLLSSFDYMASTPTLFNAGTLRSQLSSCFLTTVPDDLDGIFSAIHDDAMLSKWAGGLGNDWTPIRAMGSRIKGTNGKSQGVIPFLKVVNDTAVAVNQGGKRKGAICAYLETWHLDIEEFLETRKNTGDDRRRTHDMNTANWIPDLFMKRVINDGNWTLFSPSDVPDLHDLYGLPFERAYMDYEQKAKEGAITLCKTVKAKDLWRKMLSMLFETGHPWMTFKDPCNLRSPQQHAGVVHSSNLCTEITLNTSADEIAVCNLGSINLAQHLTATGELDTSKLKRSVSIAVRMLDNVIDINYYPVEQARNSNQRHRPVGLGVMGFQDALYQMGIPYASNEAVEFADQSMELISYYAIEASANLAQERGAYQTFDGSLWSQGILPVDSIELLQEARGKDYLQMDRTQRLNWNRLREKVKKGMRNSNLMAIAPTATISNICGVTQSIEPTYQNLYVKSNLSGEFTVVNPHLVEALKNEGLWDEVMISDLKFYDGSIEQIERIPERIKRLFATAFEVEPRWLVEAASRRQKWLDQAQSLNLYIKGVSGKKLDVTYQMAWVKGLKTTYYLRALGATSVEKSTTTQGTLNAVSANNQSAGGIADYLDPHQAPAASPKKPDHPDDLGCEACQ